MGIIKEKYLIRIVLFCFTFFVILLFNTNSYAISVKYSKEMEVYSDAKFTVSNSNNWKVYTISNRNLKNPNRTSNGKNIISVSKLNKNTIKCHAYNVGTVRIYVTDNNTRAEVYFDIKVNRRDISSARIILKQDVFEYNNGAKKPEIESVTINGGTTPIKNYRIKEYKNNVKAGLGQVYIEGLGNNKGIAFTNFVIKKRDISKGKVVLSQDTVTFADKKIYPQIKSVTLNNGKTKIADYKTEYINNYNVGTGTIKITGTGSNTGTIEKKFYIKERDISSALLILDQDEFIYDGGYKQPGIKVYLSGIQITKGLKIEYSNNKNAGTAKVIVKGINGNKGSIQKNFKIIKRDISRAKISLSEDIYIYNGSKKTPTATVKLDGAPIKDFNINYKNNINVGTATVEIEGKNNNTGKAYATFKIVEKFYPQVDNKKEKNDKGYTKIITVGNRTYKVYNQKEFESSYGNIHDKGCSITSMAIVLSGYGKNITPTGVASELNAVTIGIKDISNGLKRYNIESIYRTYSPAELNADLQNKINTAKTEIDKNLKQGKPVIIMVIDGYGISNDDIKYTTDAHYMVLVGYNEEGKPVIADPYDGFVWTTNSTKMRKNNEKGYYTLDSLDSLVRNYIYNPGAQGRGERGYVLIK